MKKIPSSNILTKLGLAESPWDRAVTKSEIQYFIDRWLYLQMVSRNEIVQTDVQRIVAKTNWTILNYGNAMASSPGEFLFGGEVNPGKGTLQTQAEDTVSEMILLAKKHGWDGVHIVSGHPLMKWAAWMMALDEGLELSGFEPTKKDFERRERVKRSEIEDIKCFKVGR